MLSVILNNFKIRTDALIPVMHYPNVMPPQPPREAKKEFLAARVTGCHRLQPESLADCLLTGQ